jgi:hypothetical protein
MGHYVAGISDGSLLTPGIKTKPVDRTQEKPNPNIPKIELPNYILGSKFQNLNTFHVFFGNN